MSKFESIKRALNGETKTTRFFALEVGDCFRRVYKDGKSSTIMMKVRCGGDNLADQPNTGFRWCSVERKFAAVILKGDGDDKEGEIYRVEDLDEVETL